MFKNITLYKFVGPAPHVDVLISQDLREPIAQEAETNGFIRADENSFTFGVHTKVVPPSLVERKTKQLIKEEAEREGKSVGKIRAEQIKEAVFLHLLERAMFKTVEVSGYFTEENYLVIDSPSVKVCELLIDKIRKAVGSFECAPAWTSNPPQQILADALLGKNNLDSSLVITDNVALYDMDSPATTVRVSSHPIDDDVVQHVQNGLQVQSIGMEMNNRLKFVLTKDLQVKSIKFRDLCFQDERDAHSDMLIMKSEFERLFEALDNSFGLCK